MLNFSFSGYESRFGFFVKSIALTLIVLCLQIAPLLMPLKYQLAFGFGFLFGLIKYGMSSIVGGMFVVLLIFLAIMTIIAFNMLAVTVRRCNDIGISPFWSMIVFLVPPFGWLLIGCLPSNWSQEGAGNSRRNLKIGGSQRKFKIYNGNVYEINRSKNSESTILEKIILFAAILGIIYIAYVQIRIQKNDAEPLSSGQNFSSQSTKLSASKNNSNESPKLELSAPVNRLNESQSAAIVDKSKYILQIGTYDDYEKVEETRRRVKDLGIDTYIQTVDYTDQIKKIRLRSGPFDSAMDAKAVEIILKENGINSIVLSVN